MTRASIATVLQRGVLVDTANRGVYRSASAPQGPDSAIWTAVLASRSVVSYLSAAYWWQLSVADDGRVHITRAARARFTAAAPGLRVHRTALDPAATTTRFGLPVTTREQTLLDCLGWLPIDQARTLLDRACQQRWLTLPAIDRRLSEQPGRWGNRQLSRLATEASPGAEAESERRLHAILRQAGLSGWTANPTISLNGIRYRIDVAFPELRVAIEVEGWAFHRDRDRRDRDVSKLNGLAGAGWQVLVFTWHDVSGRPAYVLDRILAVLALRTR